ncbi:right-handed parallel beta-helix repeat-containing protein [Candidatus Galacturonibacter soehngenii]|uniref:Right-handed parallel beta-helix repeat-containing protein n=1 Tax=Candidatus Galacturonatibacter soehngenii TaxID=2307010 RepID=A0A7V7QP43_9FIRM|nr:right-handed parallel beta-helix repeat-containing protein [Candidatus Galacturonibacter soehngenii]KAB1441019.1 right-handed parallel beta-helix repeat-containing protein [Candidatus Galacturonibacter soehngenii]MBA4688410.1 right-handed parallel beta-helix repeat-containing protein [Candidatus Galacturonibacter soehngenii]
MKRVFSILMTCVMLASLVLISEVPVIAATNYYVSPSGSDSNVGTSSSKPYKTLAKAVSSASAGSTIYMMSGTHSYSSTVKLSKNGTSSSRIKITNYSGSTPVIDFSAMPENTSNRGLQISGSYWTISGLKIQEAGDNGIYITGNNNIVQNCEITKCHDTGLQLSNGASNNQIISVTSTYHYDNATNGENADGFAAKLNIGPGNTFTDCKAYYNSDDGFDFYQAGNAVKVYKSEASYNGRGDGNGQGFKVGGNFTADKHYLENCTAIGNKARGFDQNNNTGAVTLVNCTGTKNKVNFYFPKAPSSGSHSFTGCISNSGSSKDVVVGKITKCSFNQ